MEPSAEAPELRGPVHDRRGPKRARAPRGTISRPQIVDAALAAIANV